MTDEELLDAAQARLMKNRADGWAERIKVSMAAALERTSEPAPKIKLPDLESMALAEELPDLCPDCHGRGWQIVDRGGTPAAKRCACALPSYDGPESIPPGDLIRFGVPPELAAAVKSTWNSKLGEWPECADNWPGKYRRDGKIPRRLLLYGGTGNGKSRVAAWIMRRAMANGRRCWWIDVPMAIRRAVRAIGSIEDQRTCETEMSARLSRDLVILDDVAGHSETDYQVVDLFGDWLRRLCAADKMIVATTNLYPAQLEAWHARSASRLRDGVRVKMTGKDARDRPFRFALADAIEGAKS